MRVAAGRLFFMIYIHKNFNETWEKYGCETTSFSHDLCLFISDTDGGVSRFKREIEFKFFQDVRNSTNFHNDESRV